ncbi:hypothetical protein Ade02nite_14940 [Paractinoplanes deccanensis]|uniref:Carboxypeptidase regulatory-like domain-containing protein n=1 Tax=Paractinoplanes deccanensis TaxID=113561 RepID=A0ABQ3XYM6_9ACTN|nr:hypothetical protein [Actinoplanes deccanensis]GID72853.1 hypothetical protein Ade02nite_14940 [Actinoplanes deccanensis]
MSTARFTPERYDERIVRIAAGVEPRGTLGGRVAGRLRVLVEDAPKPLHAWRRWRPGETLDDFLGRLDRHRTGRFARLHGTGLRGGDVVLRLTEAGGRGVVPRRVVITVPTPDTAGEMHVVELFPGAAAPLPSRCTVVRGRVTTGAAVPVRWARVRATDEDGADVGWAHGDDRGEFVLVVTPAETAVGPADDPYAVRLTVSAALPARSPDPGDPLRPTVDPLWDLPAEPLPAAGSGRLPLPGQAQFGPFPFDLPLGRETSIPISVP